ncbi:hypothetical protein ACQ86G_01270 [Roseateles chitinivorans]|uniref:hypothetical protein n=1 Tax=Roseateles chitinivorans TaxID=2917965 RepID=UPI003D67FAB0
MTEGQLIIAYHGCDITVRDRLVKGHLPRLTPSSNRYDWLGEGVYFFEGDAQRAMEFAEAACLQSSKLLSARPIVTPSVAGVILCVWRCWDMTTVGGRQDYLEAHDELRKVVSATGRSMPINRSADALDEETLIRGLDCAVFNMGPEMREREGLGPVQLLRAAFYQGRPILDGSEFRVGTHLQLALRDPQCVIGWFLPEGVGSALLSEAELLEADAAMARAIRARTANKPRVRASP